MESGRKTLEELITAGVFHIPDYQRYYSWTQPEWDDLWTDLITLPSGKQHYFGTVIVQETTKTASSDHTEGYGTRSSKPINLLIDGQQRLTSLALLVKAMTDRLDSIAPNTDFEEDIRQDAESMRTELLIEDDIFLLKLLDESDREYFQRIIEGRPLPQPERPSQRKMIEAKHYFDDQLTTYAQSEDLASLDEANSIQRLWDKIIALELMVYVVRSENPEKATLIFDSVNDRGRSLSTLDKTKAFLMRMAYLASSDDNGNATIRRARQAFGQMYDNHQRMLDSPYVDDIGDDAVQRYHFITYFNWSERADHQTPAFLDQLKSHIRKLRNQDPEACIDYIDDYTDSLESAFSALANILTYDNDDHLSELIDRIHQLRHARKFYPLLLKAWEGLDAEERLSLLDAIETYIFRVYAIGNHPTYTGRSTIQTLARDTSSDSPVDVWIRGIVDTMRRYEDDSQFRRTLTDRDLGNKVTSRDIRYLFYFINRERAREEKEEGSISLAEATGDSYTVEHIWPQNPDALPIASSGEYSSPKERFDAFKNRLGNLTLASKSWNSSWGNKDFQTKREEGYPRSKLWVQSDLQEYEEWSISAIEDRENQIIEDYVMQRWSMPETRLTNIDSPSEAVAELTTEERYVLKALCRRSDGGARRVIHREVCSIEGSPFDDPNSTSAERSTVGSILNRLSGVGLATRDKQTWYPTDEALSVAHKLPHGE